MRGCRHVVRRHSRLGLIDVRAGHWPVFTGTPRQVAEYIDTNPNPAGYRFIFDGVVYGGNPQNLLERVLEHGFGFLDEPWTDASTAGTVNHIKETSL